MRHHRNVRLLTKIGFLSNAGFSFLRATFSLSCASGQFGNAVFGRASALRLYLFLFLFLIFISLRLRLFSFFLLRLFFLLSVLEVV